MRRFAPKAEGRTSAARDCSARSRAVASISSARTVESSISPAGIRSRMRKVSSAPWSRSATVFPDGTPVLDYYHCAEHVFAAARAQFGESVAALQWAESSLALLSYGLVHSVALVCRDLDPADPAAAQELTKLAAYLENHQPRIHYRKNRRRAIPHGRGALESAHKCLF